MLLLCCIFVSAFMLISKRYQSRLHYIALTKLRDQATNLNKEYTRLELEEGTYSSNLVLQDFALNKLNLVQPDKQTLMEIK
jgi:cell division protein FtsL